MLLFLRLSQREGKVSIRPVSKKSYHFLGTEYQPHWCADAKIITLLALSQVFRSPAPVISPVLVGFQWQNPMSGAKPSKVNLLARFYVSHW